MKTTLADIAQSYFDIKTSANSYRPPIWDGYKDWHKYLDTLPTDGAGYNNKMLVKAELMPHKIEIKKSNNYGNKQNKRTAVEDVRPRHKRR